MGAISERGRRLSQIERVPYEDAFLIGDLLTSRITLLSGEPKAGKTLLAVAMVRALLNEHAEFLGQPVHRPLDRVVFGLTDDGADVELKERFLDSVDEERITVFPVERTASEGYWDGIRHDLEESRPGLFVLDNILGALGYQEDIASSVTAQNIIRNLRPISQAGIPVLAITHTPKGASEGVNVQSSPIGGRAIAGGARGIIALRFARGDGRRIQTAINRATRDLNISVEVKPESIGSEVPVWSLVNKATKSSQSKKRSKEVLDRVGTVIEDICENQHTKLPSSQLANIYGPKHGDRTQDLRKKLSRALEWSAEEGGYRLRNGAGASRDDQTVG